MIQTDYSPDKFGTYLSHPESLGGGIDLSDSSVREIILAYRSYRRTLNPSFNNDHILRRVDQLEKEFNDTVITEVKVGGVVNRSENQKWELCTSHTGRRTFISYNVMRCPTEAEVRKCSGHKSAKTFERYILLLFSTSSAVSRRKQRTFDSYVCTDASYMLMSAKSISLVSDERWAFCR